MYDKNHLSERFSERQTGHVRKRCGPRPSAVQVPGAEISEVSSSGSGRESASLTTDAELLRNHSLRKCLRLRLEISRSVHAEAGSDAQTARPLDLEPLA